MTAKHIAAGIPGNSCHCPVAMALSKAGLFMPAVGGMFVHWGPLKARSEALAPKSVTRFVTAFDDGEPVFPFTFDLPVEEED